MNVGGATLPLRGTQKGTAGNVFDLHRALNTSDGYSQPHIGSTDRLCGSLPSSSCTLISQALALHPQGWH